MKRAAVVIAMLGISSLGFAQGNDKPAAGQTAAPAGQTTAQQGQTTAQHGKRPPKPNSTDEYNAYKAAAALTDPALEEKAADDFAAKFPTSELRPLLYESAMRGYQQANNMDKTMDTAKKVLESDPDNPEALVDIGQVLAERTHSTDLDKDQKLDEAKKDAQRALVTVDTDLVTQGQPQDRIDTYKGYLRSEAYVVLGTIEFNAKDWKSAEEDLKKSIDVFPQQPDSVAVYRLAVALDMQDKLADAMKYCDQAIGLTKAGTPVGDAARTEKDRLTKLLNGDAPANPAK